VAALRSSITFFCVLSGKGGLVFASLSLPILQADGTVHARVVLFDIY
jgi:hypothetical protein